MMYVGKPEGWWWGLDRVRRVLQVGGGIVCCGTRMMERDPGSDLCYELLGGCRLFQSYQNAFKAATGLPLVLMRLVGGEESGGALIERGNAFCRILSESGSCGACEKVLGEIRENAVERAYSAQCFAGMRETAVPIRHAGRVVAFLKTGEVLLEASSEEGFMHIAGLMLAAGKPAADIKRLREAYMGSPVMELTRYEGAVYLLESFGRQLSVHLGELLRRRSEEVPLAVRKALHFIENHLEESLGLEEVAAYAGLSMSQFCKVFKEATNATFTEYVNRRRVEWARRELLRPGARVTEVAYRVGFSSLSQFNRCFQRYVGESPREYRRRSIESVELELVS